MEEARAVLRRLDRIDELQRRGAPAADLLVELRHLVAEAATWAGADPAAAAASLAVEACNQALARPPPVAQAAGRTLVA